MGPDIRSFRLPPLASQVVEVLLPVVKSDLETILIYCQRISLYRPLLWNFFWLDKFKYWISAGFGWFQQESVSVANELCMKLDDDWTASLKSILNWDKASYKEIVEGIQNELLIQHPTLTRCETLFSMNMEKGENL